MSSYQRGNFQLIVKTLDVPMDKWENCVLQTFEPFSLIKLEVTGQATYARVQNGYEHLNDEKNHGFDKALQQATKIKRFTGRR
jgi:hypothetical protein